jgi:hypothetical protein
LLGPSFRLELPSAARVELLGFRSVHETLSLLAECDVNYLPIPFDAHLAPLARFSFPTKLSTYLATGKPIFAHAPEAGALAAYMERSPVGVCCTSLDPADVLASLQRLVGDGGSYAAAACAAARAAAVEFNADRFRARFCELIGVPPRSTSLRDQDPLS